MSNDPPEKSSSLMSTASQLINSLTANNAGHNTIINSLSLLCILSILNNQSQNSDISISTTKSTSTNTNPLQKIIGDLSKGVSNSNNTNTSVGNTSDSSPAPDMLMSLLPMLNNPAITSKITPSAISSVMGMLNNFSSQSDKNEKNAKIEKQIDPIKEIPSIKMPETNLNSEETISSEDDDSKTNSQYLNWKTN